MQRLNVPRWAFNSAFVALVVTVSNLIFASMAGYALARIPFPGSNLLFLGILGTMMVPGSGRLVDSGDVAYYRDMGDLVTMTLGTIPESSESVLMRVANDKRSADFNASQLEGKYYYAQTAADLGPVFQQLQNQIIRLSK